MNSEHITVTAGGSAPGRPATPHRRKPCGVPWPRHGFQYARLYPCGWRCNRHAPWAIAGRPEPQPGPGWPIYREETA